ncbi:MAG: hypothetical protein ACFFAJ_05335 [Candidatus Hodarchaeota archaeon]
MYKALSLILILSVISILGNLGDRELPPDHCPFSNGDRAEYIIWGEWQGPNPSLNHGNNTGEQTIVAINRTPSHVAISEAKNEIAQDVLQGEVYVRTIRASSLWVYNTETRCAETFETYAWMWIKITKRDINNSKIKIMSRVFQIVRKKNYTFFQQSRSAWIATYNKSFDIVTDSFHTNSFEMWFDTNTGLMVYYIVRSDFFDNQGKKIEWSFYSTQLNLTTINLNQSYLISSDNPFSITWVETILFIGAIFCLIGGFAFIAYKRKLL